MLPFKSRKKLLRIFRDMKRLRFDRIENGRLAMPRAIGSWDSQCVQLIKRYRTLGQVLVGSFLKNLLRRSFEQAHCRVRWAGTEAHTCNTKSLQLTNFRETLSHYDVNWNI